MKQSKNPQYYHKLVYPPHSRHRTVHISRKIPASPSKLLSGNSKQIQWAGSCECDRKWSHCICCWTSSHFSYHRLCCTDEAIKEFFCPMVPRQRNFAASTKKVSGQNWVEPSPEHCRMGKAETSQCLLFKRNTDNQPHKKVRTRYWGSALWSTLAQYVPC